MSSAGAQAVAVALPCWACRPSAWASRNSGASSLGRAATHRASMVAAATLVGGCPWWAEWRADIVEMADGLGVGAEQAGLDIRNAVLAAERPDQRLGGAQGRPGRAGGQ